MATTAPSIAELRQLGVARVSVPVASILAMHRALSEFFSDLAEQEKGDARLITRFDDYVRFVGLDDYLALDDAVRK